MPKIKFLSRKMALNEAWGLCFLPNHAVKNTTFLYLKSPHYTAGRLTYLVCK